jgi:hypothetical protein
MPVYLDTRGNSILSVAVCDRCNRKFAYADLMPDPNFPGMRVCAEDKDNFDPWRLPARQTENISLRFPRPDVSVTLQPTEITLPGGFTEGPDSIFIEGTPPVSGDTGDLSYTNNSPYSPMSLNPVIGSISPNTGPHTGGTFVLINGNNLTGVNTVKFAGIPATFNLISSIQISAIAPAYMAGLADVTVISPFGTSTAHGGFTYT